MSSYQGKWLPEISDDKIFEKFALDLWASKYPLARTTLYGRSGQAQSGVDVVVRSGDRLIGLQCKATKKLDQETIDVEVRRAKAFQPALDELIVVTTAPHDASLVSYTETLTEDHKRSGLFEVSYHGWGDLLRILEDHDKVVRKHFSEFFTTPKEQAATERPTFRLPVDGDLNITLPAQELVLLCSEASWSLKTYPDTLLVVEQADEQSIINAIAAIEKAAVLDAEARTRRSELRDALAYWSRKMRKAELAAKLLLTDDVCRSPWLIGGCWPDTATTMRRLLPQMIRGSTRVPGGVTLKIRNETHPKLLGYINLDEDDRLAFETRCPMFNPHYFNGGVADLGHDLGLKYALPAGIAALVGYSTGHDVPIELLQRDGTNGIYSWGLYPS